MINGIIDSGQKIVTNGLVLHLDAAQLRSYPGSGTTWTDLSGNGNNGTLTNGPTFDSGNGGSIVFDGTNDYASMTNDTFGYSPGTTGELTLEIWIYPTGPYTSFLNEPPTTNLGGFIGQGYFGATTGWGIGMTTTSGINYWTFQVRNLNVATVNTTFQFTNNSWYHVVGSFTRNNFSRLYVNGELKSSVSSTSLNGLTITPNTNNAAIGRASGVFYAGSIISSARLYNIPLNDAEVLQNYNATKSRFGL